MHPSATLFLDVCVQPELGPGGAWPLLATAEATQVRSLFALSGAFQIRQGGIVCRHDDGGPPPAAGAPSHCVEATAAEQRLPGCVPWLPLRVSVPDEDTDVGRSRAVYLTSGCGRTPDGAAGWDAALRRLVAGIRDAVVFGAGVEHGLDAAVRALLRKRVRTHVVLDAVGTADPERAQQIVGDWKRHGVDGITVLTVERLLRAA